MLTTFLDQDEFWPSKTKGLVPVSSMHPAHVSNAMATLERSAQALYVQHVIVLAANDVSETRGYPDTVAWMREVCEGKASGKVRDAETWLVNTLLYRRMAGIVTLYDLGLTEASVTSSDLSSLDQADYQRLRDGLAGMFSDTPLYVALNDALRRGSSHGGSISNLREQLAELSKDVLELEDPGITKRLAMITKMVDALDRTVNA